MPRRVPVLLLGAIAAVASGVVAVSGTSSAGEDRPALTFSSGLQTPTTVSVSVSTPGGGQSQPPGTPAGGSGSAAGSAVYCPAYSYGAFVDSETRESVDEGGPGTEQLAYGDLCSDGACPAGFEYIVGRSVPCFGYVLYGEELPALPTVDDLWPGAFDEAMQRIPTPDAGPTAPPAYQGSLVNVPVWLAVVPPESVSARAEVGPVWAQVDANFVGLSWDMGVSGTSDDSVECLGSGTPWSEPGSMDEDWRHSPDCGYVFEHASTPEFTESGHGWFEVAVTARWQVRLTGSDGRDEALDPVDVTSEFDYVVFELQTVGRG